MMFRITIGSIAAISFAIASLADEPPSRDALALAAGYKASFTCSAMFSGGRTLAQVEAGELTGVYPDYREALAALPEAEVDSLAKTVSVAFAKGMPPRIAAWRPHLGCAQLPPGAMDTEIALLPYVDFEHAPTNAAPLPLTEDVDLITALAPALDQAFDGETYGPGTQTTAVVIARGGTLLTERYAEGFSADTPQRTWSVAKSIAATIIGAAVHEGVVSLDAPILEPLWSSPGDPRGAITLENLLHMSSGLDSTPRGSRTDRVYFGGGRVADNATSRTLEAQPGTRWKYANNDTLLAIRALRGMLRSQSRYLQFPFESVLHPVGMNNTTLETDWTGDFVLSSQVWTTARDLARLGMLYLQDGVWNEERLLPEGWSEFVRTPAPDQPDGDWGYGAQFWLWGGVEGLPRDAYAAVGHRGQYVVIIPSADLVVVRRGFDESGGVRFDAPRFVQDILATLGAYGDGGASELAAN